MTFQEAYDQCMELMLTLQDRVTVLEEEKTECNTCKTKRLTNNLN